MKRLLIILCLFTWFYSDADHLMGGEITYNYVSGKTYEVNVTLYRDCEDCKLGGDGGGSSTSNCSDLKEVFLRTINSDCGNRNIGKITLTKTGFRDITKLCSSDASKCQDNSTYNYGIEAHTYTGTVDFDNFSTYDGCEIQIFFTKSERSSSFNTLNSEDADLYNYAVINPWGTGYNSPEFGEDPQIIFPVNKPVYINDAATSNENDSLSYKWAAPQSNYNTNLSYSSGFNPQNFITPYCPSGNGCTANPETTTPEGIYLNPESGDIAFTPITVNQIGSRVLVVEQWKLISGSMQKVGEIRRDVMVIVTNNDGNNNPKIIADYEYNACVGQNLNFNITAQDIATQVGTTLFDPDSVQFEIFKTLDSLSATISAISTAPYAQINCDFTPRVEHIGTHFIRIKASDNHCPKNGVSQKIIKIVVHPQPIIDFGVSDLFCGNNRIAINANTAGTFQMNITDNDSSVFNSELLDDHMFVYYDSTSLQYQLRFVSEHGCIAEMDKTYLNGGSSSISSPVYTGSTNYCPGETTDIEITHLNHTISSIHWMKDADLVDTDVTLDIPAFNGVVHTAYQLEMNGLLCNKEGDVTLTIKEVPTVDFSPSDAYCHSNNEIVLTDLSPTPSSGEWSSTATINDGRIEFNQFANEDQSFSLTYTHLDKSSGCEVEASRSINLLASPEMQLRDAVVCGASYTYRLTNLIARPLHSTPENIEWTCIESSTAVLDSHPSTILDIPSLGTGTYHVIGTNSYSNGCVSTDTGWIRVDEGLTIVTNGKETMCQGFDAVNLEEYFEINAPGGGWISMQAGSALSGNMFTPSMCGNYTFSYVYDLNGCYDEKTIALEVICKPILEVNVPDSLCSNSLPIHLPTNNIGNWTGPGVTDKEFNPTNLEGEQEIVFATNAIQSCIFDTTFHLTVLPALSISAIEVPEQLCESETLDIDFNAVNYINYKHTTCGSDLQFDGRSLTYTPELCDLSKGFVQLDVTASSHLACPDAYESYRIPYFHKPAAQDLQPQSICWPNDIEVNLLTEKGNNPDFSTQVVHSNNNWNINGSRVFIADAQTGGYTFIVHSEDEHGCTNEQVFENLVRVNYKPESDFVLNKEDKISISEREIYLANTSYLEEGRMTHEWFLTKQNKTYQFSEDISPSFELPPDTGLHKFTLVSTSDFKCKDTASQSILVVPDIIAFIPNAFTPDKKGPEANETFRITSANASQFHIKIFNKWGQQVFESYNIHNSWDGTFMNKNCQMGVYVYTIVLVNDSGVTYKYEGTVNLIR